MSEAIILAGGQGLRLRPLTSDMPKPMIIVGGRPIAERQILWLRRNGVSGVIFACGYRFEKIREHFGDGEDFGVNVEYSVESEYEPLGTGGAIKQALELVRSSPFVVVNGDILTDMEVDDLISWHKKRGFVCTIVAVPLKCPYGILDVSKKGDKVFGFREKPVFSDVLVNAGIYVLNKKVAKFLPESGDIERETFPKLAKAGSLGVYRLKGWWTTIDTMKDLQEAAEDLG
ncbi:MAG: nucleotidyltransferase family protein [Candidatus Bathyarchaeota archaeon]|jgi:NDP-sugar pyrophosphorylase family protein